MDAAFNVATGGAPGRITAIIARRSSGKSSRGYQCTDRSLRIRASRSGGA